MTGIPQHSGNAGSRGAHQELWLNAMLVPSTCFKGGSYSPVTLQGHSHLY